MLATALPPIHFDRWRFLNHELQSFAFCYLASYNDADPPARVVTAFQRAWGMTDLIRIPRVNGGCPGAMVSRIQYPWGNHVTIAVEGMRSVTQLVTIFTYETDSVFVAAVPGYVISLAKTYGDLLMTALNANATISSWLAPQTTQVTFTGYSMGAAIAEYLGYFYAQTLPNKQFFLRKFASPRVGARSWVTNKPANLDKWSTYHWGDNIHMLPATAPANTSVVGFRVPVGITPYMLDDAPCVLDRTGQRGPGPRDSSVEDKMNFIAAFLRARQLPAETQQHCDGNTRVSGFESVYFHGMNSMRLLFNIRARRMDDLGELRFNYLEFPDENIWQRDWTPRNVWQTAWVGVEDPGPAPFTAENQRELLRMHNAAPDPVRPPQDIRLHAQPDGAFNTIDPILQLQRRRNRHHPVGS